MIMGKKKKEQNGREAAIRQDFGHEIWGIIFLSIGLLVLISLIAHLTVPQKNILGHLLGTNLSAGLIYFLGPIAVFFFPFALLLIGIQRFKGDPLDLRSLFFGTLLTLELCFLLAIRYLPDIALKHPFDVHENHIGFFFVRSITPFFGKYTFGPYFIVSLAFAITSLLAFRIPPHSLVEISGRICGKAAGFASKKCSLLWDRFLRLRKRWEAQSEKKRVKKELERSEKEKRKDLQKKEMQEEPSAVNLHEGSEAGEPSSPAEPASITGDAKDISDVEDEAKIRFEEELAAFRAKRNEPIKIMTIETDEIETLDEETDEISEMFREGKITDSNYPAPSVRRAVSSKPYILPDPSILPDPPPLASMIDKSEIEKNSMILEKTLMNFGVEGKVCFVSPGPVVTRYEIELAPGIKVSRVVSLHDDLSMAVGGLRIRIEAPIPGKSAVGIELPNAERQIVHFKHILLSDAFRKSKAKLPAIIGTNVSGSPYVTDVAKMPHVLIAGQTGSGKSVCINSIICSLLMTMKPEDLRLIMIDPKKVELAFYEGIPHLMSPVVTESKEAVKALKWGVAEMERRYRLMAKVGARNVDSFNARIESGNFSGILPEEDNKRLPFIVIIVDELADLMMTASKDVEVLIQRIAQLARAVGLHLIVATQRPSVDIITGPIKANLTSRIAFRTIQSTDSRTILGHIGAEKLLGMGDMLFLRNGAPEIERFHGAFISEEDVERIVKFIRDQQVEIDIIEDFGDASPENDENEASFSDGSHDELFEEAARIIVGMGQGSTSLLQRRMKIGYARAGRLMDELEKAGIVGPPDGSKAREVLVKPDEIDSLLESIR